MKNNMETFNDIINRDQLTLVDFFATWCGPCKTMHPVLEQLKDDLGDSIKILKVDVDKNEALAMQYRIQSVPTLMLFRKGEMCSNQSTSTVSTSWKLSNEHSGICQNR